MLKEFNEWTVMPTTMMIIIWCQIGECSWSDVRIMLWAAPDWSGWLIFCWLNRDMTWRKCCFLDNT